MCYGINGTSPNGNGNLNNTKISFKRSFDSISKSNTEVTSSAPRQYAIIIPPGDKSALNFTLPPPMQQAPLKQITQSSFDSFLGKEPINIQRAPKLPTNKKHRASKHNIPERVFLVCKFMKTVAERVPATQFSASLYNQKIIKNGMSDSTFNNALQTVTIESGHLPITRVIELCNECMARPSRQKFFNAFGIEDKKNANKILFYNPLNNPSVWLEDPKDNMDLQPLASADSSTTDDTLFEELFSTPLLDLDTTNRLLSNQQTEQIGSEGNTRQNLQTSLAPISIETMNFLLDEDGLPLLFDSGGSDPDFGAFLEEFNPADVAQLLNTNST